jgi:transcriptional regulator with XRE-family HTH domain
MSRVQQLVKRNIRDLKANRNLLWAEIADGVGVRERQVYRWAKDGGPAPSDENLEKLAEFFGVEFSYFFQDHAGRT